jgi:hypothetical protein
MSTTSTLAPSASLTYTSSDYNSLLTWIKARIPQICPEWTDLTDADLGMCVAQLLAGMVDMLKAYQDVTMNEGFIDTAVTRDAMSSLLQLINYDIGGADSATVYFVFGAQLDPITTPSIIVPQLTSVFTTAADGTFLYFETFATATIALPVNTTIATVVNTTTYTLTSATGVAVGQSYYFGGANGTAYTVLTLAGNQITINSAPANAVVVGDQFASPRGVYSSVNIIAYEGQTHFQEVLGTSDGLPNLEFNLSYPSVLDDNANGGTALSTDPNQILLFINEGTGALLWTEIADFAYAGPNDNVYTTSVDENGFTHIYLGNNQNGRTPAPGAQITATYRTGGGTRGNIPVNTPNLALAAPITGIVSVTNPVAASGGQDAETINHARASAPSSLAAQDRDVTAQDFATDIILSDPTIIAAQITVQSWNVIEAYVLTNTMTPISNAIPSSVQTNIENRLAPRMMVTERMILVPVTLINVTLAYNLYILAGYSSAAVSAQVQQAILGYFTLGNLNINQNVYSSILESLAQAIPGVDHLDTTAAGPSANSYNDVPIGAGQVAYLAASNLTITSSGGF